MDWLLSKIGDNRIHYNHKVDTIDYSNGSSVTLRFENGPEVTCDHVIVTVSLGHLKANADHMFVPKLLQRKMEAIDKIGAMPI